MLLTIVPYAFLCAYFPLHLVAAAPAVSSSNSSHYVPPPPGGLTENPPTYQPKSPFDFQSINLALNQEWIELDLFRYGLARFSDEEFEAAGLNASDRFLIEFMAEQEVGHAQALTNVLGPHAAKQCTYTYPFETVPEFIDFSQKLTRWGEWGVFGFLNKLNSRSSAQILLQSIATEARQQMIFRQFEGLFPMPVWFESGLTQSMTWTLLSPYITTCPAENPHIEWNNFPALNITNSPDAAALNHTPAITQNYTSLSYPGREVFFTWENPGEITGYNNSYVTAIAAKGPAKWAAWISQYNVTYTELLNISGNAAYTLQPGGTVYPEGDPIVNGTMFIALTDENLFVTPFNISELDVHVVAGPAVYQAD